MRIYYEKPTFILMAKMIKLLSIEQTISNTSNFTFTRVNSRVLRLRNASIDNKILYAQSYQDDISRSTLRVAFTYRSRGPRPLRLTIYLFFTFLFFFF